jgi:hypothetical protein
MSHTMRLETVNIISKELDWFKIYHLFNVRGE